MIETKIKKVRCAIYTRKSTEEGLEQDFNSLDAQREACEAYVKSQQHEGWVLIEKQYNDGGFSGGSLDRPAVQELFKDIEAGEVDIVVVYKVDRLTRSLMDFAKIVELFDKQNASFVSITQHFNTTTSMGRLTLNILLSFAQFEREVTGERIRDKFAASKKKGMWMGGCVPIGYKLANRKLEIDPIHSKTVKLIFEKYLEFKSIAKVKEYLKEHNFKTVSGRDFFKGHLYSLIQNKTYLGLIVHKGNIYDGEHPGIIEKELFDSVQRQIQLNRVNRYSEHNEKTNALLLGKIFDDNNNRMTTTHSSSKKRKYSYYISLALDKGKKGQEGSVPKIPSCEIEKFVIKVIKEFLTNKRRIQKYIDSFDVGRQNDFIFAIEKLQDFSDSRIIRALLSKVIVSSEYVEITLCGKNLLKVLEHLADKKEILFESKNETESPIVINRKTRIARVHRKGNLLIIDPEDQVVPMQNPYLMNAIIKSHYWNKLLVDGKVKNIAEIQRLEGMKDPTYVKNIMKLKFIPAELTEQIIEGTQPIDMTVKKLLANL